MSAFLSLLCWTLISVVVIVKEWILLFYFTILSVPNHQSAIQYVPFFCLFYCFVNILKWFVHDVPFCICFVISVLVFYFLFLSLADLLAGTILSADLSLSKIWQAHVTVAILTYFKFAHNTLLHLCMFSLIFLSET